jgi:hypothetical protein
MPHRSIARTLADLRILLEKLDKDRDQFDRVSLAQLRRILRHRIAELDCELRRLPGQSDNHRAA